MVLPLIKATSIRLEYDCTHLPLFLPEVIAAHLVLAVNIILYIWWLLNQQRKVYISNNSYFDFINSTRERVIHILITDIYMEADCAVLEALLSCTWATMASGADSRHVLLSPPSG
jgi:hypothetical protein